MTNKILHNTCFYSFNILYLNIQNEITMKATLTFPERHQAEKFTIAWGRHTKTGHMIGSGSKNVKVTIWDVDDHKEWIDNYAKMINKQ